MSERSVLRVALPGLLALMAACAGRVPAAKAGIPGSASGVPRSGLEVVGAMRRAHPSRELRFAQSIDSTIMWLDSARVRYGLVRLDELDGRRVWVVGATKGDIVSPQFWVDAERWRVPRVIQRETWNANQLTDLRYGRFAPLLSVPVPTEIAVYRGGRLVQRQEITVVKANPRVPAGAFSLSRWRSVN